MHGPLIKIYRERSQAKPEEEEEEEEEERRGEGEGRGKRERDPKVYLPPIGLLHTYLGRGWGAESRIIYPRLDSLPLSICVCVSALLICMDSGEPSETQGRETSRKFYKFVAGLSLSGERSRPGFQSAPSVACVGWMEGRKGYVDTSICK